MLRAGTFFDLVNRVTVHGLVCGKKRLLDSLLASFDTYQYQVKGCFVSVQSTVSFKVYHR